MNVLIVDTDKIDLHTVNRIVKNCMNNINTDDWLVVPKGIDIMQDISVDWMKMIRDTLDNKIKELENNTK
jgi:hypothetical protein